MTALDTAPAGFLSHEAAQGARKAKLDEIDLLFAGIRDDIHTEHAHNWAAAMVASCARIRAITERVLVLDTGVLVGSCLLVQIAVKRLMDEWENVAVQRLRLDHVRDMALEGMEKLRLERRGPYDFSVPLAAVVEDAQCGSCGWMTSEHWTGGTCPGPARQVCGSCDFGVPMNCVCKAAPAEPKGATS